MNIEDTETQDTIDLEAATAEISSDLFGQDGDEEKDGASGGQEDQSSDKGTTVDAAAPPAQQSDEGAAAPVTPAVEPAASDDNSAAVQAIGAPKTWNKEELATWATIPPEIQAKLTPILERREADFLTGITQYKSAAELGASYDKVVEPYKPMLAAENVDPVQLFQSFAGNHYLLSRGTPEQKVALAASLISGYGIPLADLLNHIAEAGIETNTKSPEYTALEKRFNDLEGSINSRNEAELNALREQRFNEVTAFAEDKVNHPYFDELADDIRKLFEAGLADNLDKAYEMAVYANPTTRQKEIDRLTAERTSTVAAEEEQRKQKVAKSTAEQVRSTSKARDGTIPTGSIDDTLNETMAAIASRG